MQKWTVERVTDKNGAREDDEEEDDCLPPMISHADCARSKELFFALRKDGSALGCLNLPHLFSALLVDRIGQSVARRRANGLYELGHSTICLPGSSHPSSSLRDTIWSWSETKATTIRKGLRVALILGCPPHRSNGRLHAFAAARSDWLATQLSIRMDFEFGQTTRQKGELCHRRRSRRSGPDSARLTRRLRHQRSS